MLELKQSGSTMVHLRNCSGAARSSAGCPSFSSGCSSPSAFFVFTLNSGRIDEQQPEPLSDVTYHTPRHSWFLLCVFLPTAHWCYRNDQPFNSFKHSLSVLQRFPCFTCWMPEWRSVTCVAAMSRSALWLFTQQRAPKKLVNAHYLWM